MKKNTTQKELSNRICPICGEGHVKGKKWVFAPNKFLPNVEDGKAVCQKHYKQAYSIWRFQTKLKGNKDYLANRREQDNRQYAENPEYRKKILEKRKKERETNSEKIKEYNKNYNKTKQGKKLHRMRCKRYYDKDPIKQQQRMKTLATKPQRQYTYIKRRARVAGIIFDITFEEFLQIRSTGICHYCKNELSPTAPNIDRLDSTKGYVKDNCVACCLRCNTIKRDLLTPEELIMYHKVLSKEIEPPPTAKYSLYTPNKNSSLRKRWGRLVRYTTKKKIPLELTFEQYQELIIKPCEYCGVPNLGTGYGIDRINPLLGYTFENSVSCCPPCNQIKGNILTKDEMKLIISIIAFHRSQQR